MCDLCGCGLTGTPAIAVGAAAHAPGRFVRRDPNANAENIEVLRSLLAQNDRVAQHNREHFDDHGVLAVNLMSSPGAGKTSLLEASIPALRQRYRLAVIEGDLATENDARRIRAHGVPAVQITTGNACHLDAQMIHGALHELDLATIDLLVIENVGNLVCPASFDLGQHCNVALLSVPEGDDKPEKYPVMFRAADLVLLSKTDLLEHCPEFALQRVQESLRSIASGAPLLEVSSRRGVGIEAWCTWVQAQQAAQTDVTSARAARLQPRGERASIATGPA